MVDRIEKLLQLLEAEPNDAFCLYGLAQEYARRGEYARAVEYYDQTLLADADELYAYYHKAKSLEAIGELDAARAALVEGSRRAAAANDQKALSEIAALLDELT